MRKIKLSQGKYALIDNEDYEEVSKYKWHYAIYGKNKGYAKRNNHNGNPRLIRMHRFLINAKKGEEVDHINGNTIDNRRKNLRIVTRSQNMMNCGLRVSNKTGYKGVCFVNREQKWLAKIWKDNKPISLGLHKTAKDAAKAYNKAAAIYHGEYALLNKI